MFFSCFFFHYIKFRSFHRFSKLVKEVLKLDFENLFKLLYFAIVGQEFISQGNLSVLTISSSQSVNLTSPGWPGAYPRDVERSWLVNASQGSDILVSFLDFETIPPNHVLVNNF